jgi:hypothetical protein
LAIGVALTVAKIFTSPSIHHSKPQARLYRRYSLLPIISLLTLRTAFLKPSTLAATSFANRLRPSSLTRSASSRCLASSCSSGLNVVGPLIKKLRITGELAVTNEESRPCKYDRKVTRFFSRARDEAVTLCGDGRGLLGMSSALSVEKAVSVRWSISCRNVADVGVVEEGGARLEGCCCCC